MFTHRRTHARTHDARTHARTHHAPRTTHTSAHTHAHTHAHAPRITHHASRTTHHAPRTTNHALRTHTTHRSLRARENPESLIHGGPLRPCRRLSVSPSNRDARSPARHAAGPTGRADAARRRGPPGAPEARAGRSDSGQPPPSSAGHRRGALSPSNRDESFSEQPRRSTSAPSAKRNSLTWGGTGRGRCGEKRRTAVPGTKRICPETHTRPASIRFPAASSDSLVERQLSGRPA